MPEPGNPARSRALSLQFQLEENIMFRGLALWMLGIPIPIIILILLFLR